MAVFFLRLDLDDLGITAQVIKQKNAHTDIMDDCRIVFKDLPDDTENMHPFDAGMSEIATQMDLEGCSNAVLFVSPFSVYFRNMALPFTSEKKIEQVLPFELETDLPLNEAPYISDFLQLDLDETPHMVLSASILESDVETYFRVLAHFGLKPDVITHKGYAAAVSFLKERSDVTTFLFMHITDQAHTLVLIKDRKPCKVRVFNPARYDAEKLALAVNQTIMGFRQRTGLDIAFDIFLSAEHENRKTNAVYEALDRSLQSQSRLRSAEHEVHKILVQEKINGTVLLSGISPGKKTPCLFNFCKGKFGTRSFIETYFTRIAVAAVLALVAFGLSVINITMDQTHLEHKIAALDDAAVSIFTSTFPEKKRITDPYLQMKANVQALVKTSSAGMNKAQTGQNGPVLTVGIMSEASRRISAATNMEITRFLFSSHRLILSGSTDNFNTVDSMKSKLESSDLFQKVSISSAAADKKENRVNFKFIIEM